jgi:hypothetical protein
VFSVYRDENDVTVAILELIKAVLECKYFRWANEAEGCWDEEQNKPR